MERSRDVRRWAVTLLASLAVIALGFCPLPGVDHEALAQLAGGGGLLGLFNLRPHVYDAIGPIMWWLVIVRGAVRLVTPRDDAAARARWIRRGLVVLLVLAALSGLVVATLIERDYSAYGWFESAATLAPIPLRLAICGTYMAVGAALWALASWVSARGVMHGALAVAAARLVPGAVVGVLGLGQEAASAHGSLAFDTMMVLYAVAPALLVVIVSARRRPPWPAHVARDLFAVGTTDCVLVPYVLGFVVSAPLTASTDIVYQLVAGGAPLVESTIWSSGAALPLAVAIVAAVGTCIWLRARGAPQRSIGRIVLGAALAPLAMLPMLGAFVLAGGVTRALDRGPYAGGADLVVELEGDRPTASHDAPLLAARLSRLDVDATIDEARAGRIRLTLHDVSSAERVIAAVAAPNALAFHFIALDQGTLAPVDGEVPPPGVTIDTEMVTRDRRLQVFVAPSAEALAPIAARLGPSQSRRVAIECRVDSDEMGRAAPKCFAWALEEPAVVRTGDVTEARVDLESATNRPCVMIELSSEGARRFEDATRAHVGRKLAIVIDGMIQSAPIVVEAIPGGRAIITVGGRPVEDALAEANALAASLASGALESRWSLASLRAAR